MTRICILELNHPYGASITSWISLMQNRRTTRKINPVNIPIMTE